MSKRRVSGDEKRLSEGGRRSSDRRRSSGGMQRESSFLDSSSSDEEAHSIMVAAPPAANLNERTRVFVLYGDDVKEDFEFRKLPHPKIAGRDVLYIVHQGKLLEMQRGLENPSSWFYDQNVIEDGTLFMGTPIDPIFLILPFLKKQKTKFVDLEQLWDDNNQPSVKGLSDIPMDLSRVCDTREVDGQLFYRLSDDKLMSWLQGKLNALLVHMSSLPPYSAQLLTSTGTVRRASRPAPPPEAQLLKSALGFLSEYAASELIDRLAAANGMEKFEPPKVSATDLLVAPAAPPVSTSPSVNSMPPPAKKQKVSPGAKALEKVDTSKMKSLAAFFKPKTPK